ncbi:MAG: hypothetical protein ACKVZJ_03960 [Phycisphaerales bacterium]
MNRIATLSSFALALAALSGSALAGGGKIPDYIGADLTRNTNGVGLVTAAPYPSNRPDDVRRIQNGRLWVPRTPIGTRTPIRESVYGFPGPGAFGAPVEAINDTIYVQTREPLPLVTVSPWVNLDTDNIRQIRRDRPWLRRPQSVLADLRAAQVQHLTEQGYIQKVRTHVNPTSVAKFMAMERGEALAEGGSAMVDAKDIKPRAVIRVRERMQQLPEPEAAAPAEQIKPKPAPVVRVTVKTAEAKAENAPAAQANAEKAE